jgi:hypothetical protein
MNLRRFKKGQMVSNETIKWIIWIALLVAVSWGVKIIVDNFAG